MPKNEFYVEAHAHYEAEQSMPQASRYRFSYTITVKNTGQIAAQLIARHWCITNAHGEEQTVDGLGVVGRQPLLQPGESFTYDSACELATSHGTMQGRYLCVNEQGEAFACDIPLFVLEIHGQAPSFSTSSSTASRTLH